LAGVTRQALVGDALAASRRWVCNVLLLDVDAVRGQYVSWGVTKVQLYDNMIVKMRARGGGGDRSLVGLACGKSGKDTN